MLGGIERMQVDMPEENSIEAWHEPEQEDQSYVVDNPSIDL